MKQVFWDDESGFFLTTVLQTSYAFDIEILVFSMVFFYNGAVFNFEELSLNSRLGVSTDSSFDLKKFWMSALPQVGFCLL